MPGTERRASPMSPLGRFCASRFSASMTVTAAGMSFAAISCFVAVTTISSIWTGDFSMAPHRFRRQPYQQSGCGRQFYQKTSHAFLLFIVSKTGQRSTGRLLWHCYFAKKQVPADIPAVLSGECGPAALAGCGPRSPPLFSIGHRRPSIPAECRCTSDTTRCFLQS